MPRQYLSPCEFRELPLALSGQVQSALSHLGQGVLDKMLFRASQQCDSYCQKRLQAPGSTTLSASASAGATQISVASTLTFDELSEQAVIIGSGGAQETILIQPGGVSLTLTSGVLTPPYPGTITLAIPLQYAHSSGEIVQGCYMETSEVGSSSMSDSYTEAFTQEAQLALAHIGPVNTTLARVVFLKNYPIIQLYRIEHAYPYTNEFSAVSTSIESIVSTQGWYRFNIGSVVMREGLIRTTYTGGYQTIPDDVKVACSLFVASQLQSMVNPFGLAEMTMGKRTQRWSTGRASQNKTLEDQAKDHLKAYRRTV